MISEIIYAPEFEKLINELFPTFAKKPLSTKANVDYSTLAYFPTVKDIPISRVTYSGNKTIVWFIDGTKTTVTCSSKDNYDRQTAIAYALIKRIFGKIGRTDPKTGKFYANEIDGNGIGIKLEKIAAAGFDQDLENKNLKAKKALAKIEHEARQKAEHDAAWAKRVKERAEEIRLEREANALLDQEDSLRKTGGKKPLNESNVTADEFSNNDSNATSYAKPGTVLYGNLSKGNAKKNKLFQEDSWKSYKRPDKPFRQFTQAEKRDYWKYQNAKRRAAKEA